MRKCAATLLWLAAALFLLPSCASLEGGKKCIAPGTLKIGWGKRSIAMPGPVPITGQFHLRVALETYTPVEASALVLEDSKDAVIFVSCDVVSVNPKVLMGAREILKKEIPGFPVEKLIINATHTHTGPSTNNVSLSYPNKVKITPSDKVQKFISRQIADAVKEAWNNRAPGAVSYGYGFATTGHSRRSIYLRDMGKKFKASSGTAVNGHGVMYGRTSDKDFASYEAGTDAFINLLYTFNTSGKLTGAVINVPCPAQTSENMWSYNASFWHNVREKLKAKYGEIGVIAQSAAGGDLAPRQLHYQAAEKRRYFLKYRDLILDYVKKPMARPVPEAVPADSPEVIELMRAEDIANRIIAAFDEVLSWAGKEKFSSPILKHQVRTLKLARKTFPKALVDEEKRKHAASMKEQFMTEGNKWVMLRHNSRLNSRRRRMAAIGTRYEQQKKEPYLLTDVHAVRIGDIAFATNRFELFLDYQHRIQGRSPFDQTFIVQLVSDPQGTGSYLATERGERNKGYSATPYSNRVSHKGGQQLVNETLKMLEGLVHGKTQKAHPSVVTVPRVKGKPGAAAWNKAALLKDFCVVDGRTMSAPPAEIRLLHDGKFLYIKGKYGVSAKDDKIVAPPAEFPARDGSIWGYESCELFIGSNTECFQFIIGPGNKVMDLAHTLSGVQGAGWDCKKLALSSKLTGQGWEMDLALPLNELKSAGKDKYRFNIVRTNFCTTASGLVSRRTSAYWMPAGAYKNISAFGTLKLAK